MWRDDISNNTINENDIVVIDTLGVLGIVMLVFGIIRKMLRKKKNSDIRDGTYVIQMVHHGAFHFARNARYTLQKWDNGMSP